MKRIPNTAAENLRSPSICVDPLRLATNPPNEMHTNHRRSIGQSPTQHAQPSEKKLSPENGFLILIIASPVLLWGLIVSPWHEASLQSQTLLLLIELVGYLVAPIITILLIFTYGKILPKDIGYTSPFAKNTKWRSASIAAISIISYLAFIPIRNLATHFFSHDAQILPIGRETLSAPLLIYISYLALTAAIVEETFYRAILFNVISSIAPKFWQIPTFVAGSSILFAVNHLHDGAAKAIATFYLGAVSAIIYTKTRNIWYLILAHFILNYADHLT